jgi:spermidine/putrescine transport system substrate-binding protein
MYKFKQIKTSCTVLFILILASCGRRDQAVKLYNWSEFMPSAVLIAFEQEHGIQVEETFYETNEEMYSMLRSGAQRPDIAVPTGDFASIMLRNGMLQVIDKTEIPNFKNFLPDVLTHADFDPYHSYSIPYAVSTTGININTMYVQDYENSWAMFQRPELYGRMSVKTDPRELIGNALKFLGYSANTQDTREIIEARDFIIDEWRGRVVFDTLEYASNFALGEIWVEHGHPESIAYDLDGDLTYHSFVIPKEGGLVYMDSFVLMADAKNVANAHKLINHILRLDMHVLIMDEFWYPVLMEGAREQRTTQNFYDIDDLMKNNYEFRADVGSAITHYNRAWADIMEVFRWDPLIAMHNRDE